MTLMMMLSVMMILMMANDDIDEDGIGDDYFQGAPFCSGGSGSHLALVGYFTSLQNEHHAAGIRLADGEDDDDHHYDHDDHGSHPRVSLLSPGPLVEEGEGSEVRAVDYQEFKDYQQQQ